MLEKYFSAPRTLDRLRSGISGGYIDGFADELDEAGYAPASAVRYLRAAAHLGHFLERSGFTLADIDPAILYSFRRHLPCCRCPLSNGGRTGHHAWFGAKRFHEHLIRKGVCQSHPTGNIEDGEPALVASFRDWFRQHRGVTEPTLRQYCRGAVDLLENLGGDVKQWDTRKVRMFLLDRTRQSGASTVGKLITSTRAFLLYLSFRGECRVDLDQAVPAVAHWRLARLPRCLSAGELDRIIAACDGDSPRRLRDRAILLMLAQLGLRAGDVAQVRLTDIDWENGTLQVMGKGRYQVRLPLPQEVGDALLSYLECRPQAGPTDHVFLRNVAPFRPFFSGDGVSSVVKRALERAGVEAPAKGAHLLRHTAATEMLRHGVPLEQIGLVLRHRSIDMTAYYAKVDTALLQQVARPWPGVNS